MVKAKLGLTVKVVEALTEPDAASIVVAPTLEVEAKPFDPGALLIVATPVADELHVTVLVRFCMLPSLYVCVAVNCCVVPKAIEGFVGAMVNDTSAGGPTVTVVEPHTEPAQALTVAEPAAAASAVPRLLASSVTLTATGFDELQLTEASCSVLLSLNVPIAVKRNALPKGIVGLLGLSEIERRFGGVRKSG